jgi:hypothetical protein
MSAIAALLPLEGVRSTLAKNTGWISYPRVGYDESLPGCIEDDWQPMATAAHELVAFEEARAHKRRRRYRVWLPIAVVLVMLAALIGIAVYDYKVVRVDAVALSRGVIGNL